jgi:hypothetical protein
MSCLLAVTARIICFLFFSFLHLLHHPFYPFRFIFDRSMEMKHEMIPISLRYALAEKRRALCD